MLRKKFYLHLELAPDLIKVGCLYKLMYGLSNMKFYCFFEFDTSRTYKLRRAIHRRND